MYGCVCERELIHFRVLKRMFLNVCVKVREEVFFIGVCVCVRVRVFFHIILCVCEGMREREGGFNHLCLCVRVSVCVCVSERVCECLRKQSENSRNNLETEKLWGNENQTPGGKLVKSIWFSR